MHHAEVAELADALDSKSSVVTPRAGSTPAFGTIRNTPPAMGYLAMCGRGFNSPPLLVGIHPGISPRVISASNHSLPVSEKPASYIDQKAPFYRGLFVTL